MPRRTVHYVAQHDEGGSPFTEDHTLAALYIKAETQKRSGKLLGVHTSYYPVQLRRWRDCTVLIDLLGLSQSRFKVNVIPDVSRFKKAAASEVPALMAS